MYACLVASVMSNSLQPHGLLPTKLLCPWDSTGKNTGIGCCALLQGIFPTQGSNPTESLTAPALAGRFFTTSAIWEALVLAQIGLMLGGKLSARGGAARWYLFSHLSWFSWFPFSRMEAASTKVSFSYWQETQQNLHVHLEEETLISPQVWGEISPPVFHVGLWKALSNWVSLFVSQTPQSCIMYIRGGLPLLWIFTAFQKICVLIPCYFKISMENP